MGCRRVRRWSSRNRLGLMRGQRRRQPVRPLLDAGPARQQILPDLDEDGGDPSKSRSTDLSRVLAKVRPTREHAGCNRRAATDIQLRENPPDMLAYGVAADAELPCDLLVDFSVTDQQGYLQLTPGQYLGGRERKIGGGARHADGVIDQVLRAGADDASYWPALICMIVWITAIVRVTDGDQRMAVHDKARSIRFRVALFS